MNSCFLRILLILNSMNEYLPQSITNVKLKTKVIITILQFSMNRLGFKHE